jgi:hypothetical protein
MAADLKANKLLLAFLLGASMTVLPARTCPAAHPAPEPQEEADEGLELEGLPEWVKRFKLTGAFEGDFQWSEHGDITEKGSDPSSELLISTAELGVEAAFTDWMRGFALLLAEDLGTGEETDVTIEESTLSIGPGGLPFYVTMGKRALPFGVFENNLVADPMTQDAYETNRVGLTLGYVGPWGSDVSFTVYKGEELMEHLFESGLFDTEAVQRAGEEGDNVESFIISATAAPVKDHLTVFAAYCSEPGRGRRNNTMDIALSAFPPDIPYLVNLRFDVEYMKALQRETFEGLQGEFKEGVLSASVAYDFVLRKREVVGGALFRERKAYLVSEPVSVAVRYERFYDDGLADDVEAWSVQDRMSAGGRYTFYSDGIISAYVAGEYRMTSYRVNEALNSEVEDENDELLLRLGLVF